jgi:hypothetical protein
MPVRTVTDLDGRVTESTRPDHRKRGGQHSSPFGPPPDFELSVADARRRAVVPHAPRGRRRSVGVYLPVEVLRSCGTALHLSVRRSPYVASALNRHRLRRLSTQLPEGARIAPGRLPDAFTVGSTPCVGWLRTTRWRGCAGLLPRGTT